jgi:hypothetical protein
MHMNSKESVALQIKKIDMLQTYVPDDDVSLLGFKLNKESKYKCSIQ